MEAQESLSVYLEFLEQECKSSYEEECKSVRVYRVINSRSKRTRVYRVVRGETCLLTGM